MSKTFVGIEHQHNVFPYNNQWYFWDETGTQALGPFVTEVEAYAALIKYAREDLEGIQSPRIKWFTFLESEHFGMRKEQSND